MVLGVRVRVRVRIRVRVRLRVRVRVRVRVRLSAGTPRPAAAQRRSDRMSHPARAQCRVRRGLAKRSRPTRPIAAAAAR